MQVCARSSKFSLFDPAKEMAYIQMSRKEKSKGKAAVDLIGSQVMISCPLRERLMACLRTPEPEIVYLVGCIHLNPSLQPRHTLQRRGIAVPFAEDMI